MADAEPAAARAFVSPGCIIMAGDRLRQGLNLFFAAGQVAAAALPPVLGLPAVGAVSDRYPTYVVPAGYAFSIWSLIFAVALAYAVWQALPARRADPLLRRIGWLTAAAFAGSTLWELVFPAGMYGVSLVLIAATLASLAVAVGRMTDAAPSLPPAARWLAWLGCGLYLGWITVATVASAAQALLAAGVVELGLGAEAWGIVMLGAAGLIGAAVTWATRNAAYPLGVVWALVAVFVARREPPVVTRSDAVAYAALAAAAVVAVSLAAVLLSGGRRLDRAA
jgi:hypothetical protein